MAQAVAAVVPRSEITEALMVCNEGHVLSPDNTQMKGMLGNLHFVVGNLDTAKDLLIEAVNESDEVSPSPSLNSRSHNYLHHHHHHHFIEGK